MPYEIMGYDDDDDDELMGFDDDELLGDDDDDDDELLGDDQSFYGSELLGRRRRRKRKKRGRKLKRRGYSRERGLVLGFGSQSIATGVTVDFVANPQVPFRGKRLILSATSLNEASLEDLKIGKNSMLVSAQSMPAEAFGAGTFDQAIKLDTAVPGIEITATISSSSVAANVVNVGMFGVAAER